MICLKTDEEIELMRIACRLVGSVLAEIAKYIIPGVLTLQLDKIADEFIHDNGAIPVFKGYNGFPSTICVSVNENVVHGIPGNYFLKNGDIVSIDCGVKINGYCADSAYTFEVGEVDPKVKRLLKITKESLYIGINNAVDGKRIGDIGSAIQTYCENAGYSVVRELVGHGIGKNIHELPEVPNYGVRGNGCLLKSGMCIAVEPMINLGTRDIKFSEDGWTVYTVDRKPSAHFEHTVAIRSKKVDILSTFDFIDKVLNHK
ncbi:MAG: type I methionyl aminopeptidase [Bacteroidales bacterium OttesenSCG-928-I14]|jgi:methionyl aminopeptidase|nr:type I methionyl aminopeptidase [Bacteroidales bacterium OttesenSCG-928-I14]